eukprot:scaffold7352_cov254-Pinguiococcus_pyrenoidosus.AAC.8
MDLYVGGDGGRIAGKLIVATEEGQEETLHRIAAQAKGNGVLDLKLCSQADVKALEPQVFATAALLSPSTGIVDRFAGGLGGHAGSSSKVNELTTSVLVMA